MNEKKFSDELFWDCKLEPFDYQKYPALIVDRVVHRGKLEDWNLMKSTFGVERIKQVLKELKYLNPKVLRSMSKLFDIPLTEFRSYRNRGLMHWWE